MTEFINALQVSIKREIPDLDFDITSILKLWKSETSKVRNKWILKKIQWLKDGIEIRYKQYILRWIKGRLFSIKHITRKKQYTGYPAGY